MSTLDDLVRDYILSHELVPDSERYYRRMAGVLQAWARQRISLERFTPRLVNEMLLDKQRAGLSSHYRRSLRNAMRALLGHKYGGTLPEKLRTVRLTALYPEHWTAAEVRLLIDACEYIRDERRRLWWQTIIAVGYYTGFSTKDLWRLKPSDIGSDGIVRIARSKTGAPLAMRIPDPWLGRVKAIASKAAIWGRPMSKEVFRVTFARVVRKAGLSGTFKVLRKSCGTSVEQRHPGQGHIALGNSRRVFESHYLGRRFFDQHPSGPDALPE